ncbi:IS3 family transposase [Desulfovibrio desulfuricans]|uniref:IS3 family transposase n=1 Tax=Desulfovibrio desulfuricans TaxID=876 RepID=UPI00398B57E1|nr:IS3 family transposase [Desulfovibrio desulfuricans]
MIFFCGLGCWNWQEDRRRFGSPPLHELLRREGLVQNHKRTERIYQEENLSLRTRKRVKRPSHARIVKVVPLARMNNGRWIL